MTQPDQSPDSRARDLASRLQEAEDNAWWKGKTALVQDTDEQLAVVGPRADIDSKGLRTLGQRLKEWQASHPYVRHIWGLDDFLAGRGPRTPPIYLMVPHPVDRFAEQYEPVALIFVAKGTDHKEAMESLGEVLEEFRGHLAWFERPHAYSYYNR